MRSAVEVELERGGQVYFVHNRVETIYEIAAQDSGTGARGSRRRGPRPDGRDASWSE